MKDTLETKLGTNKGVPRSRIWIEGKRLTNAGFKVGRRYDRKVGEGRITLNLNTHRGEFGVTGKRDHPIIDITGAVVTSTFPRRATVTATYHKGKIVIA